MQSKKTQCLLRCLPRLLHFAADLETRFYLEEKDLGRAGSSSSRRRRRQDLDCLFHHLYIPKGNERDTTKLGLVAGGFAFWGAANDPGKGPPTYSTYEQREGEVLALMYNHCKQTISEHHSAIALPLFGGGHRAAEWLRNRGHPQETHCISQRWATPTSWPAKHINMQVAVRVFWKDSWTQPVIRRLVPLAPCLTLSFAPAGYIPNPRCLGSLGCY